jgi:hypothetical protein
MKRVVLFAASVVMTLAPAANAATFEPKVKEVCARAPTEGWVVNRSAFVARLIQKHAGVSAIDLRPDGEPVTYDMQAAAILNPEQFCKTNGCSPETAAKLGSTQVVLHEFLVANSSPYSDASYRVIGPASVENFLIGTEGTVTIQCFPPAAQQQAAAAGKQIAAEGPRRYFGIRKNIDDFRYSQNDPEFKKVERASLTFKHDYEADSEAFGIDGVAGYTFGPAPIGRSQLRLTPFVQYKQDTVNNPGAASDKGVYDLGVGAVGGVLFPIGNFYQDLQLYPKYVHSYRNGAETLIANVVYSPEPAWAFIGHATYIVRNVLSAQFTPQLKAAYGEVFDAGGNPTLLEKGEYFRWGPKVAMALYGEDWLKGFLVNLSYETYDVSNAKITSLERFEAALNYTIGEKELWALQLKYVSGQDLDTWEDQNQVTLGAGLKY